MLTNTKGNAFDELSSNLYNDELEDENESKHNQEQVIVEDSTEDTGVILCYFPGIDQVEHLT